MNYKSININIKNLRLFFKKFFIIGYKNLLKIFNFLQSLVSGFVYVWVNEHGEVRRIDRAGKAKPAVTRVWPDNWELPEFTTNKQAELSDLTHGDSLMSFAFIINNEHMLANPRLEQWEDKFIEKVFFLEDLERLQKHERDWYHIFSCYRPEWAPYYACKIDPSVLKIQKEIEENKKKNGGVYIEPPKPPSAIRLKHIISEKPRDEFDIIMVESLLDTKFERNKEGLIIHSVEEVLPIKSPYQRPPIWELRKQAREKLSEWWNGTWRRFWNSPEPKKMTIEDLPEYPKEGYLKYLYNFLDYWTSDFFGDSISLGKEQAEVLEWYETTYPHDGNPVSNLWWSLVHSTVGYRLGIHSLYLRVESAWDRLVSKYTYIKERYYLGIWHKKHDLWTHSTLSKFFELRSKMTGLPKFISESCVRLQRSWSSESHHILRTFDSCLLQEYFSIKLIIIISFLISLSFYTLSYFTTSQKPSKEKSSTYECGFEPYEDAKNKFYVQFFIIAVLFVLFDIEILVLLPWSLTLSTLSALGYWIGIDFLLELCLGYLVILKSGALDWYNKKQVVQNVY